MEVDLRAFSPFNRNIDLNTSAVRPPEITLCSDGCIRGIFHTILPYSFFTTPANELAEDVVWIVLNVSALIEVDGIRESDGRLYAIPIFHMGGEHFRRLHVHACLVSIQPEPEGWSSGTPLLILDIARSPRVIDVTFELSNNNRFSIVYDTVDCYDTNGDRNRPEGPLIMRWDREHIWTRKFWVAQYMEQPECFLIFSVSTSISRGIPIIRNRVRPFSGSFEALRRQVKEIRAADDSWRAEKNAESSVIRIEGFDRPVSVRVRRVALGPANRAILDLNTDYFRYKVHIDCLPDI
jgi:hypothetical protein